MRDLLIITPTRGRPESARRLASAVAATATATTDLVFAIDADDRSYDDGMPANAIVARGARMTCPQWTNKLAGEYQGQYRAYASLGDDHVPETQGWDRMLLDAIDEMGGVGLAYPDDCVQHAAMATAPVVSASIVRELGWFMYPAVRHVFADNVWMEIAREAGCLRYVPEAVIRHLHWSVGTAPRDLTYRERDGLWTADEAAWRAWQMADKAMDVARVRALMTPARE